MNLHLMGLEWCLKLNKSYLVHVLQVMPIFTHIVLSISSVLLEWFKCNTHVVSTYKAHQLIMASLLIVLCEWILVIFNCMQVDSKS